MATTLINLVKRDVMKKLLISLLVFSFSSSVYSKDAESNGFRNINWQESFTKYIDIMSLSSKKGG